MTASSTLIVPAGKALLITCVNTSFGLPVITWIGNAEVVLRAGIGLRDHLEVVGGLRARQLRRIALDAGLHQDVVEPAVAHLGRRERVEERQHLLGVLGRGVADVAAADGDRAALVAHRARAPPGTS